MAIGTYAELKTAVASWLHRTDLTSQIPDFISMAESLLRHDVRVRAMEATATGTLSAVTLALPTRFAQARRVLVNDKTLRYMTPEEFQARRLFQTGAYTILGTNFIFQTATGSYQIDYYQWFAPLSAASDTNWLLTNHPDLYLYASLTEAALFLGDDPAKWAGRYSAALDKIKKSENSFGGPLVIRPEIVE